LVGTATYLPYPNNTFDTVVDVATLQHLSWLHGKDAIKQILCVLKPGGLFFSLTASPLHASIKNPISPIRKTKEAEIVRFYTGFQCVSYKHTTHTNRNGEIVAWWQVIAKK
jgi:ubiquinone/menaquinone biosynthesis C-methylase UbiE